MNEKPFDAITELQSIREKQEKKKQKHYHQSKLNRWRVEIVDLYRAGASLREISYWLLHRKKLKIRHTSVRYFINKLPELKAVASQPENV